MMIARCGNDGNPPGLFDTDNTILGTVVCYGFFIISLVQLIGILLGDKAPIQVNTKVFD